MTTTSDHPISAKRPRAHEQVIHVLLQRIIRGELPVGSRVVVIGGGTGSLARSRPGIGPTLGAPGRSSTWRSGHGSPTCSRAPGRRSRTRSGPTAGTARRRRWSSRRRWSRRLGPRPDHGSGRRHRPPRLEHVLRLLVGEAQGGRLPPRRGRGGRGASTTGLRGAPWGPPGSARRRA